MASRYGLVKQRRSRRSYGIRTYVEYKKKYGDRETCRPVKDDFDETDLIEVVDWLVRKVCSHQLIKSNTSKFYLTHSIF
jgi:hypothetical protein